MQTIKALSLVVSDTERRTVPAVLEFAVSPVSQGLPYRDSVIVSMMSNEPFVPKSEYAFAVGDKRVTLHCLSCSQGSAAFATSIEGAAVLAEWALGGDDTATKRAYYRQAMIRDTQDAKRAYYRQELISLSEDVLHVHIWGPIVTSIDIGLEHVRASDGIRIKYDFERDGWVILQSSELPDDWQEVAFVRSWARSAD